MSLKAGSLVGLLVMLTSVASASADPPSINNNIYLSSNKAGATTSVKLDFGHDKGPGPTFIAGTDLNLIFPPGVRLNASIFETCPTAIFKETAGAGCQSQSQLGGGTGNLESDCPIGAFNAEIRVYKIEAGHGELLRAGIVAEVDGVTVSYQGAATNTGGRITVAISNFAVPPIFSCQVVLAHGVVNFDGSAKVSKKVKVKNKSSKQKKRKARKKFRILRVTKNIIDNPRGCDNGSWTYEVEQKWTDGSTTRLLVAVNCRR